jgi:hypothetical protein
LDKAPEDQCILINGLGRSGTTWLGAMLQNLLNARSIFEPFFPRYVLASKALGHFPYLEPGQAYEEQAEFAHRVLSGKFRNRWVDRDNRPAVYSRRLVKEIRASYMLPWLHNVFPGLKIIQLVRDPLDVYRSWHKLGWIGDQRRATEIFALHSLLENKAFVQRYSKWADYGSRIYPSVRERAFFFDWFTAALTPLIELDASDCYSISYDELNRAPVESLHKLLAWLEIPVPSCAKLEAAAVRESSTAFAPNKSHTKEERLSNDLICAAEEATQFFLGLSLDSLREDLLDSLRNQAEFYRSNTLL